MAEKRAAFRENIHRLFDEAQATDLAPGIVSLIDGHSAIARAPAEPRPATTRSDHERNARSRRTPRVGATTVPRGACERA